MRSVTERFALTQKNARIVRLAEARCRLGQRIEHRLQIEGRAAYDLEHVGGGGLLLQRFAQLVEQARVLNGDDGLRGKVLDQLDLLTGGRLRGSDRALLVWMVRICPDLLDLPSWFWVTSGGNFCGSR
jgi:hypothetical protein